jgi:DNA-binding CsgD family transcriptional regulator
VSSPTPRERDVLDLLCRGESNKVIASRLGISEQAIKGHVSRLFVKFRVQNRAGLVAAAMRGRDAQADGVLRGVVARSQDLMKRQGQLVRQTRDRVALSNGVARRQLAERRRPA